MIYLKNLYRLSLASLLLLGTVFLLSQCQNTESRAAEAGLEKPAHDPLVLIFLLQYISRDYQYAVAEGKIINTFEYQEMMTFSHQALELYLEMQQDSAQPNTIFQLQQLREIVHEKVETDFIDAHTKVLITDLNTELKIRAYPPQMPSIERGKQLYQASGCGTCHGSNGAGDGPVAATLTPGPGNFQDIDGMNTAVPYHFFNAIRLGIEGTSMPAFQEAFSIQEAWDISFYLLTLRAGLKPVAPSKPLNVSLSDLATKSNNDLLEELQEEMSPLAEPQKTSLMNSIDDLRLNPASVLSNE